MSDALATLDRHLAAFYGGRPWLLAVDILQAWKGMHAPLARWGVPRCFALGARMGTGPVPPDDDPTVAWACLGLPPARDLMDAIHGADAALRDLPDALQARIDAFDPEGEMLALGAFFSDGRPVAGRRMVGARPQRWQDLEDKVVIDALWDAVGIPRAPSEVVPATLEALTKAAERLDDGAGTVWAGDAREGFHGGASRTHWVQRAPEARAAVDALAPHCDTVRVQPFLEGIPCSIHGIVCPDGVVVLRPAEMLVLRRGTAFVYARAATFWDPPPAEREAMRAVARQVGVHLATTVGYRGAFTIDGVLTAQGFRPTELNPRVGAAMAMMADVPFPLVHYALIEGVALGVDAATLEAELLAIADDDRRGSFGLTTAQTFEAGEAWLAWRDAAWHPAEEEGADAHARWGPGPTGGFLNVRLLTPRSVERGPSFAPRVAAFATWADAALGTNLGPLQPAPDVSPGRPAPPR